MVKRSKNEDSKQANILDMVNRKTIKMHEEVEQKNDIKLEETQTEKKKNKKDKSETAIRKKIRKMDLGKTVDFIEFETAKNLIRENPECGLKAVRERRHISIPYHLIGGHIQKAVEFIARSSIGKYRREVGGVVIAIGLVEMENLARVIDEQPVVHLSCKITQIIFRPQKGQIYTARVVHISKDFISALILDSISIAAKVDAAFQQKLKGLFLEMEDMVDIRYEYFTVKRNICQLNGVFMKIVKKGESAATAVKQETGVAANKRTLFAETDDEDSE